MRRLALARSRDGVHWDKQPMVIAGDQPWDSKVICDPSVIVNGNRVTVWFGGGDVAHPAQNIHGQIGLGELLSAPH
jgi:sucrose-6-phosphate hydrolase SacC (GH32 family)